VRGVGVLIFAGCVALSHAQVGGWRPERAVEFVVPTKPGGSIDATMRLLQRIVQNNRILDVPVVVANKPGGGGALALSYLDQHVGDAHYVMISTMSLMTNHILGRSKVTYSDYTPLAILFSEYMTLVVRPDSPLKTGRDLQQRLKANPGSLSIAVGTAIGATNHLNVALLANAMGIDAKQLKTVVFQANADAQTAVMGGHVDVSSLSVAAALRAAEGGRLRILGITAEKRGEGALAEIPTWKEQGYDVVFSNTRLLVGPKGLTQAQTAHWDNVLERVAQSDEWKSDVQKNHAVLDYAGSKQSPQRMAAIYKQLKGALVAAGLAK
jgi:putative tricarboxylic transport membrane protein